VLRAALVGALCGATSLRAQGTTPASAQPPASLDQVETLIAEGRTEDARSVLTAWMAAAAPRGGSTRAGERTAARTPSRADAQHALWLRALLTVDPAQAAVDYRRLVVEYPGGPYSDQALLRLAQTAQAQGDPARARELLSTLLRDYPRSPTRLAAGQLLESLPSEDALRASRPESAETPPVTPAAAPNPSPQPVAERPAATAAPPAASAPAPATAQPSPAAAPTPARTPTPTPRWTVQLGAFASAERANGLRDELAAAGIEARLVSVPGTRLIHVRTGHFASQPEAERARDRLTARGLDATVAGDADREEAAR
jgi:cell division protein FtsN